MATASKILDRVKIREIAGVLILLRHGAQAVRPHEITIDKRLEHLPLHSLWVGPWLGDEPPAQVEGAMLGARPGR